MGFRRHAVTLLLLVVFVSGGCGDDSPCPEGLSWCWGECVDLWSDELHCGVCDGACGLNAYCTNGACVCFPGFHFNGTDCLEGVDPCEGVTCSGHGLCAVSDGQAVCVCDSGYHADGRDCVQDPDPCAGVSCSGHGQCAVSGGRPVCACDPGYHADGLSCVQDSNPCEGVTCSDHGQCVVQDDSPVCICDYGYHPDGLTCIEDHPQIAVEPDTLDFGNLHIRDARTQPVTVRNDGADLLNVTDIEISGGLGDFSFTASSLPSMAPGDSATLQITFSPASVGSRSATLELTSNDPDNAVATVALMGEAIDPDIFVLPVAPIDLGQVLVGQSREETVYIHKAGTGPLRVRGISLTVGTSSDFTLVDVPTLPATIDSSATPLTFKIRYSPSSVGTVNGFLQIDSTDLDAPYLMLAIRGEGTSP